MNGGQVYYYLINKMNNELIKIIQNYNSIKIFQNNKKPSIIEDLMNTCELFKQIRDYKKIYLNSDRSLIINIDGKYPNYSYL